MRKAALVVMAGLAGMLLLVGTGGPAAAHGGDPILSVQETHPADTSVHYIIKMVWENDGDPINDETVTATPTGPDGVAGAPVTLANTGDGIYEGTVDMPTAGAWSVTFATVGMDPGGSITQTENRPEPASTTTSTPATTDDEPSEPTEEAAAANQDEPAEGGAGEDDDSGSAPALILVGALVVVILGGLGAVRTVRRHSTPQGASASDSSDTKTTADSTSGRD